MTEHEHANGETGGKIVVSGTIAFNYYVESSDCNVFSLAELTEAIKNDPIGWFIDMHLGEPTLPFDFENTLGWKSALGCDEVHLFGQEGWRPAANGGHEHWGQLASAEREALDRKMQEKYDVVRMDVRPLEEKVAAQLSIEVLEKYLVLDPDYVPVDSDGHIQIAVDDPRP